MREHLGRLQRGLKKRVGFKDISCKEETKIKESNIRTVVLSPKKICIAQCFISHEDHLDENIITGQAYSSNSPCWRTHGLQVQSNTSTVEGRSERSLVHSDHSERSFGQQAPLCSSLLCQAIALSYCFKRKEDVRKKSFQC